MSNLLDKIFGNCEKGVHRFESYLVHIIPPSRIQELEGYGVAKILDVLSEKKYEIRCEVCGKKAE